MRSSLDFSQRAYSEPTVGGHRQPGHFYTEGRRSALEQTAPATACDDIGDVAAGYLLDQRWAGKWSRNLMGPENLTPLQVAAILSDLLKKPIGYHQVSLEQMDEEFARFGANEVVRSEFKMLMEALGDSDGVYATSRTPDSFTPTTLRDFLGHVLKVA